MNNDYSIPLTRREKKAGKERQIYNNKHIRIQESVKNNKKNEVNDVKATENK